MDSTERCKPRLKLFLSVDVIDSTAYKNMGDEEQVQPWLAFFRDFYTSFPIILRQSCEELSQERIPQLWKSIGDELVFVIELERHQDASLSVQAFRNALRSYEANLHEKDYEMHLKATAWLAGFPVINAIIEFEDENGEKVDYIGPQIDIGFRLAKFSSTRKFVVAVELALMLVFKTNDLEFFYDSEHVLKGVLNDVPYPIIWIDMDSENKDLQHKLRGPACTAKDIQKYCEQYIERTGKPLMKPFIDGDSDFGRKPDYYDEAISKISHLLVDERPCEEAAEDAMPEAPEAAVVEFGNDIKSGLQKRYPLKKAKKKKKQK